MDREKLERWNAILDDLFARVEEKKQNKPQVKKEIEPEIVEETNRKFDFEKMAFERLKTKIGDSKITLREYHRLMGAWFCLKKGDSRTLLHTLKSRFPIDSNNKLVWLSQ
ncbi:MAG: hypothetical protein ABII22_00785 [Candidatus Micrarchaeota archaeon]